ncbi:uncharacterized protein LOC121430076 [Lytechinus variegatus]|uniref:uncharacterized protein LOC121430076 n=1 Tax=Lytechinus variegatus TaxID=7654 RepID=UPI001BB1E384|nr:uncharacterized protein LOC121430076 [Lytechinus variegatus]
MPRDLRSQSNPKTNERIHAAGPGAIETSGTHNVPVRATTDSTSNANGSLSLMDVNKNMESSFSRVFEKLDYLTADIAAIKTKVNDMEGAVEFNSGKVMEIEKDIIPNITANLESRIADLQNQLTSMEIYNRRSNLLIYGLHEDPNENIFQVIRKCIVDLGIAADEAANMAFVNAHRLHRRATQDARNHTQPTAPSPIIVKFVYMTDRNKVLSAFENRDRRPRPNVQLPAGTPTRISIRTDLPPALKARRGHLAKIAYDMRKKDGVSTKILLKNNKVCLQWKQKGASTWNDYQLHDENAYPQSALCVFSLNDIDGNFTEGDFFGSDGDVQNDLWRANDGSTVSPRHGADCSNPNTASNNFLRDYNLMDVPAVQINDTPLTMVGDRFSNLEMTNESYIISSERGCLYQFNISTSSGDLGDPCHLNDTIEGSPIKDLESHNNGYMVTTPDNAYGFSSCNVSRDPLCSQTAVFPQPGDYSVRPNSVFNIYTENTFDSITITNITGEITDGSYLLLRNETLDAAESLVHYQILIIDETNVTMTGCDGGMMEFIISLIEPGNYTRDELVRRCDDWDLADNTSQYLKAKETSNGNFQSTILIENRQVTACENCPYNDCTTDCCEY